MGINIDSIKRKLLIKYPSFGKTTANLQFVEDLGMETAATDGKYVYYNPTFVEKLNPKEQIFLFAHEICHVALDHILRSEDKNKMLWNIATDSVINAWLVNDNLPLIKGGVNIPDAINHDSEEMYEKLLKEKEKQEQQNNQNQDEQQQNGNSQKNQSQNSNQKQEKSANDKQNKNNQVGHDSHEMWDKAIEDLKKEKLQNDGKKENKEEKDVENTKNAKENNKISEKEIFEKNKEEREKKIKQFEDKMLDDASHVARYSTRKFR